MILVFDVSKRTQSLDAFVQARDSSRVLYNVSWSIRMSVEGKGEGSLDVVRASHSVEFVV